MLKVVPAIQLEGDLRGQGSFGSADEIRVMKILFLHGWHSVPGGVKPSYLARHGHEVVNPALDDDDFDEAVRTAQAEYNRHHPDVIVGSSRGGAVAMNLASGSTPLVLLCPAWKRLGMVQDDEVRDGYPAPRGRRRDTLCR